MRIEIVERELPRGGMFLSLVNKYTRKYIGQLGPFDNYFNANRIKEATDLYQDLQDAGMLKAVLQALEKRQKAIEQEDQN